MLKELLVMHLMILVISATPWFSRNYQINRPMQVELADFEDRYPTYGYDVKPGYLYNRPRSDNYDDIDRMFYNNYNDYRRDSYNNKYESPYERIKTPYELEQSSKSYKQYSKAYDMREMDNSRRENQERGRYNKERDQDYQVRGQNYQERDRINERDRYNQERNRENDIGHENVNGNDYANHECTRDCSVNKTPKTCVYNFTIEFSSVLGRSCLSCTRGIKENCYDPHCVTTDGHQRAVLTANRMLPGPFIQVCRDDKIIVNVHNALHSFQSTSIHWHGIKQRDTPHMDGVSLITQCAISPHSKFEYKFKASDPGTHFWHAHSSGHRADGLFGALVVRDARDQNKQYYNYDLKEHVIVLNDWMATPMIAKFNAFLHDQGNESPDAILINGRGADKNNEMRDRLPRAEFTVEKGFNYRFRVINAGLLYCPLEFSIENHNITVIATDGNPIQPIDVVSFFIFSGERIDFVLNANRDINSYWIKVKGHADCEESQIFQTAILTYKTTSIQSNMNNVDYANAGPTFSGKKFNPFNTKITPENKNDFIVVDEARSAPYDPQAKAYLDKITKGKVNKKFYLALDMNFVNNPLIYDNVTFALETLENRWTSPQINNITFHLPETPLMYQKNKIPKNKFCNVKTADPRCANQKEAFCSCIHTLNVNLNELVEVIVVDGGSQQENHPIHLHGNSYAVLGVEKLGETAYIEDIKRMDQEGNLKRNLFMPPLKDTVTIPSGGYTIFRFYAENPGFWFMHCHIDFHSEGGMALLFKVGDEYDLPKIENPETWPQCGNYAADIYTKNAKNHNYSI